jgi:HAD superfamily hydrolase (TIGR01509 family)
MRLKAIIFDVDGTLAETEEAHRTAFNRAFAEAGRDWHWSADGYRELLNVTGGRERIRHFLGTVGETETDQFIADLHATKNAIYANLVESGEVDLRPGIKRIIDEARRDNVRTAIATTTSRTNLTALLDCHFGQGAVAGFDAVVTGEDVAHKKPDPEAYTRTLSALALAPDQCIAIEDSRNGLLAAAACGIAVLVTPSLYTSHEQFAEAAAVRADLDCPYPPIDIAALDAVLCASQPLAAAS